MPPTSCFAAQILCSRCFAAQMGPATRYTLRRNTATIDGDLNLIWLNKYFYIQNNIVPVLYKLAEFIIHYKQKLFTYIPPG